MTKRTLPRVHVLTDADVPMDVLGDTTRFVGYDEKYDIVRVFFRSSFVKGCAAVSMVCPTSGQTDDGYDGYYEVVG
jgi:hypothetical protein